jgi:hypothetical protein
MTISELLQRSAGVVVSRDIGLIEQHFESRFANFVTFLEVSTCHLTGLVCRAK